MEYHIVSGVIEDENDWDLFHDRLNTFCKHDDLDIKDVAKIQVFESPFRPIALVSCKIAFEKK